MFKKLKTLSPEVIAIFYVLLIVSFLIASPGVWIFLDNSFYLSKMWLGYSAMPDFTTFSLKNIGYGVDQSLHPLFRTLNSLLIEVPLYFFAPNIAQIITFSVGLFVYFVSSRMLFRQLRFTHASVMALLFTINPLSIYFLNQSAQLLAYASFPLIVSAVLSIVYSQKFSWFGVLQLIIGFNMLLSYPRITIIGVILTGLISFGIVVYMWNNITKKYLKIFLVSAVIILSNSVLLTSISYKTFIESKYSYGPATYAQEGSEVYGPTYYTLNKETSFKKFFVVEEITPNAQYIYQDSVLFTLVSLLLFAVVIMSLLSVPTTKAKKIAFGAAWAGLLLVPAILLLAKISSRSFFINFTYFYIPAFQNNTSWIYLVQFFSMVYIIGFTLENKNFSTFAKKVIFVYCFMCSVVFLPVFNNKLLNKLDIESLPDKIKKEFLTKSIAIAESSIHYPGQVFLPTWSTLPVDLGAYSTKPTFASENTRIVTPRLAELYLQINSGHPSDNLAYLNVKNIYVHNIYRQDSPGFPYFNDSQHEVINQVASTVLSTSTDFVIEESNEFYKKYKFKNHRESDYFLYLPRVAVATDIEHILTDKMSGQLNPIFLDIPRGDYERIASHMSGNYGKIFYKYIPKNMTRYYVRVKGGGMHTSVIVLNLAFNPGWKLREITRKDFEEVTCVSEKQTSSNDVEHCAGSSLYMHEYTRIGVDTSAEHVEGNLVGNAWVIPVSTIDDDDRYYIIEYDKQLYINYALLVQAFTFVSVLIFTLFQWRSRFKM